MNHLFLRRNELISIVIALAMLLAIGVFAALDWSEYLQKRDDVTATRQLLDDTSSLLIAITDAESSQRGYLLTGNPAYLELYGKASAKARGEISTVDSESSALAHLYPSVRQEILRLKQMILDKLAALGQGIDFRRNHDTAAALALLNAERGEPLNVAVRNSIDRVRAVLSSAVGGRTRIVRNNSDRSRLITILSCFTLLVLLALGAIKINVAAGRRELLITSLERSRRQASQVRDLLKTTLFSIGDAVVVTNAHGAVTYLNRVAESLTGWVESEAAGKPSEEIFRTIDEFSGSGLENPIRRALDGDQELDVGNQSILLSKDGREIPIDASAAPIRAPGGELLGVVLVFRDVTNRRNAERERERLLVEAQMARLDAEQQRSHLHSLFLQAPASINIYRGPEHIFELLHPLARGYIGGRDATGMRARDVVADPGFVTLLDEVYQSGEPRSTLEVTRIVTDEAGVQSERQFNYFCCPWRDSDNRIAGVMTLAIDVTESVAMKRAMHAAEERLRESAKLESLGVLAGGIAHDFNNLLVGVMGNASLALEEIPVAHPARGMIEDVVSAAERAAVLTRQMLAYSGKGQFVIENVNFSDLVRDMLPLIKGSIPRRITLITRLKQDLPPVEADIAQLQQVFMNLVINAAEACGEEPGTVSIITGLEQIEPPQPASAFGLPAPEPGSYVYLEVSDTGLGMDAETRARIFDPFFTTKFTGRGLGLSAVIGIMRAHKGAVRVASEVGRGSTFRVLFPVSTHPAAPENQPEVSSSVAPVSGSGTVLIIDDEDLVRRMARTSLERHGYTVLEAQHGRDALERFKEYADRLELVILDLTMPVMSGEQTLQELRRIRPDLAILLSSGFSQADATRRFGNLKLAGFLQKPYTAAQLLAAVAAAIPASPTVSVSFPSSTNSGA